VHISTAAAAAVLGFEAYLSTAPFLLQVKVAEHILTGHKVAIKILNRRKIQAMDMDEKGVQILKRASIASFP
jgi:hypothetical protein